MSYQSTLRGPLSYRRGIGLGDTTPCARTAPSADGLSMECIDANNNVVSSTPITSTQAAAAATAAGTTFFGLTPTSLAIGAAGGLALIMLLNKKKGRR